MVSRHNPLTASAPREIYLPKAPLVRVVTRIDFPIVVSIAKADFIAPFQEALRSVYPVLRPEQALGLVISSGPGTQQLTPQPQTTWRFSQPDNLWRVALAPNFLALETTAYQSRDDFVQRAKVVVDALAEHINPQIVDRMGLRFIDRVVGAPLKNLAKYVRPEVVGVMTSEVASNVRHSLTESLFDLPEEKARLLARWAQVPPNSTVDPAALDAIEELSWILDLDIFSTESGPFTPKNVLDRIGMYAERIYSFFRWAVTEEFLKLYGGRL
jgi:uncharacterized protein (TIGR04255 family)